MLIPQEFIGFHKEWLNEGHEEETIHDLDTKDMIKAIVSFHYDMMQEKTEEEFLSLLDRLAQTTNPHRESQIQFAKTLIREQQLSIVDAIFLLFRREELFMNG